MYNDKKAYRSRYTKWLCMKTTAARSAASSSSRVTILLPARNAAHPITGRATGSWGTAPTRHYTVMDMPLPRRIRLRSKNQVRLPTIPTPLPRSKKRNAWPAMRSWTETPSFAPTAALDNRGPAKNIARLSCRIRHRIPANTRAPLRVKRPPMWRRWYAPTPATSFPGSDGIKRSDGTGRPFSLAPTTCSSAKCIKRARRRWPFALPRH